MRSIENCIIYLENVKDTNFIGCNQQHLSPLALHICCNDIKTRDDAFAIGNYFT